MAAGSARAAPPPEAGVAEVGGDASRDEAKSLDERGREAFSRGDYRAAADAFARAHALLPHAATLYNEALSWERAGELARAITAYGAALAMRTLDEPRARASEDKLVELRGSVGRLRVDEPAGGRVTVGFHRDVPLPAQLFIDAGESRVTVELPTGGSVVRVIDVSGGETMVLAVDRPAGEAAVPVSPPPGAPSPGSVPVAGIVLLGVAGATGVVSVVLGVQTLEARDRFEASARLDAGARDEAIALRAATNITAGGAVIAGAVGLWLVLAGSPGSAGASSTIGAYADAGSGGVELRF